MGSNLIWMLSSQYKNLNTGTNSSREIGKHKKRRSSRVKVWIDPFLITLSSQSGWHLSLGLQALCTQKKINLFKSLWYFVMTALDTNTLHKVELWSIARPATVLPSLFLAIVQTGLAWLLYFLLHNYQILPNRLKSYNLQVMQGSNIYRKKNPYHASPELKERSVKSKI